MRLALAVIIIALVYGLASAQDYSIEKAFERDRRSLAVERFSIGEDATSGFYYLVYKSRREIRKIRSVWNGGCCQPPEVKDFYFKDGSPVLCVKLSVNKRRLKAAIRGSAAFGTDEKLYLKDSKLTAWIEKGKQIPPSDPRWKEKEKSVLEEAKEQLENYRLNREER